MNRKAKILIVDDEYDKAKLIINLIEKEAKVDFKHVSNSKDALKKIKKNVYDVLIIDLQIPETIGDDIDPHGGQKLLEYIDMNSDLNKPTHILGITVHKDSYEECQKAFQARGWSLILGIEDEEFIKNIILAKIRHAVTPIVNYDVAILTALEHTELEAIKELPCDWIPIKDSEDCNIYYSGTIRTKSGKSISLIATSCHHMGIAQAAAVGMKMCLKYKPDFIFMTGIAAGIEGKVQLGDILFADPCWDWGSGKQTIKDGKAVFLSAPRQLPLDQSLKAKLKKIATTREYLDDIYNQWPASNRPPHTLNAHLGPVASGAVVLEDPVIVAMIQSQHRETIGIEMEAYGLCLASSMSSKNPPKTMIIKSVCDFADPEKNNEWQSYAAYTSAQIAMKIIANELYDDRI